MLVLSKAQCPAFELTSISLEILHERHTAATPLYLTNTSVFLKLELSHFSPLDWFCSSPCVFLETVIVSLILYCRASGKTQHPSEGVPDPIGHSLVAGSPVPNTEDVLLEPDGDNSATDLLPDHELLAEHRQHQVLPAPGTQTFPQPDNPLASKFVGFIFPHGFDPHLKQVKVAVASQFARFHHVTVDCPKLFTGGKPAQQFQILVKIVTLLARTPSTVPKAVLRLKPVLPLRDS